MLIDKDISGKALIVAGVLLLFIGILFIGGRRLSDQLILTIVWFFGSILFVAGLVREFDLFASSTIIGKLGAFLMSVSVVLVVTGLILFSFKEFHVTFSNTAADKFLRGGVRVPNVYVEETHPYVWAFSLLAQVAIFFFVVGLLLKLYDEIF